MKAELPKLRLCIVCGKLFEPKSLGQYMHDECKPKWEKGLREKREDKNNGDVHTTG